MQFHADRAHARRFFRWTYAFALGMRLASRPHPPQATARGMRQTLLRERFFDSQSVSTRPRRRLCRNNTDVPLSRMRPVGRAGE